ncbi:metallophosphoesterase [Fodinisporobacter ferrooxydans]|uniref:Phosphoesterase n=1 Tax=Fodinisporobacter ferrooxydans TaxID=2901836 RepID=A0ABY4CL70_9BACL|nr:metallophosphoesterase [Alicyclobacillaceae bacterium MYW30-H2]
MRICLISDSHGNRQAIATILQREQPDLVLHAGDHAADMQSFDTKHKSGRRVMSVAGNCDLPGVAELEKILDIGCFRVFLSHGHRYRVKENYLNLFYKAEEIQANVAVFGHTHVPTVFVEQGRLFVNPGSVSLPRGYRTPTYVVIDDLDTVGLQNTSSAEHALSIRFLRVSDGTLCDDLSATVHWDTHKHQFRWD